MAIAIYEATSDGRHYWAEPTAPATVRNLAAGAWVLFADSPSTPPPNADPLDAAMAERATDPTSAFSVAQRAASVAAVEDAADIAPTGAWDFAQAPTVAGAPIGGGGGSSVTASQITDSTTVGRNVLTAPDTATARGAIGAGTSSLAIGTTSTTAKAGNYQPTAANISDSTATGRSLLTAANAAAVRTVSGAPLGTGITEVRALTQADYNAIGTKSATTLYVIQG